MPPFSLGGIKMGTDEKKTLIHDLYLELKRNLKVCKNTEYIINLVFPYYLDLTQKKTPIFRNEIYNANRQDDFRNFSGYILDENARNMSLNNDTYEKIRKDEIASFLKVCISEKYLGDLKKTIINLLNETDIHSDYKLREKLMSLFERLQIIKKIDNELEYRWFDEWVDALYYYFYYAVTDKLHSNIAFSAYPELEEDLDEYNNKVTLMYGVCGNPGMYQLYSMAEREDANIIALYECGELEYYGKGPSGVINYQKAYDFYERTRKFNTEHPLATWSIAYMKFHYSVERAKSDYRYRVSQFDDELSSASKNSWFDSIIMYAQSSYSYGCAAAANLLGQIVDSSDEVFPLSKRGAFKYISSKQLYKESADGGYVYGCNNYANCCLKEANETIGIEKISLIREAIQYLRKSADLGNPWASNKLGYYYLNGLVVGEETIIEVNTVVAYELFEFANVMCRAENYYWPFINLCKSYWLNSTSNHYRERDFKWIKIELEYALDHIFDDVQKKEISMLLQQVG